jgi:hypothetical protein
MVVLATTSEAESRMQYCQKWKLTLWGGQALSLKNDKINYLAHIA